MAMIGIIQNQLMEAFLKEIIFVEGLKNACRYLIESCQMSLSVWYLVPSAFGQADRHASGHFSHSG